MSLESATAFLKKMNSDAGFAKAVTGAASKGDRLRIVTDAGFSFMKAELDAALGAISDDDLSGVVGGRLSAGGAAKMGTSGGLGWKCDTFETTSECIC